MIEQYLNKPFWFGHEQIIIEPETDEQYLENGLYCITRFDHIKNDYRFFTWVHKVTRYGLHWSTCLMNKTVNGVIPFEDLKPIEEQKEKGVMI